MTNDCNYMSVVCAREVCTMQRDKPCEYRSGEGVMYKGNFYSFCNLAETLSSTKANLEDED